MEADPVELCRLAQLSLDESILLFDALQAARDELTLSASAVGGSDRAVDLAERHTRVVEAAGTAVERLVSVLEEDMDSLYQTAFAYLAEDQQAADDLSGLGGRLSDV